MPVQRSVYDHAQMRRLVDPVNVAVIGLSRSDTSFSARTARNLSRFSRGKVYGVNPAGGVLHGVPCVTAIGDVPVPIDCAVIAVPIDAVEGVVEACAAANVGGCVIYASGFAETGLPDRVALQRRIAEIGAAADMRIAGPNCMGLINNVTQAGMSFSGSYAARRVPSGPVGLVSQSGGLGQAIAQVAERGGAFSHFLACGNSCDVDVCDYVSFLADDPDCRVIACVLEGLKDGSRFIAAAERVRAAGKPLVVYKIATGRASAAAAMSHTGTLAGSNAAFDAACRLVAALQVRNLEEVYQTSVFLAKAGRPRATGVAIIGASGGSCVIGADKAEECGVALPQPQPRTQAVLDQVVPDFGSAGNPCDITAQVATNPQTYVACAEALLNDPGYAALVVMAPTITPGVTPRNVAMFSRLAEAADKPVCMAWMSEWREGPGAHEAEMDPHVALFHATDRVFRTLRLWFDREALLAAAPLSGAAKPDAGRIAEIHRILRVAGPRLSERDAKGLLALYGVAFVQDCVVQTADDAVAAAESTGYPVVLKVESPDIPHKTEAGVVRLGLRDAAAVRAAFDAVTVAAKRVEPPARIAGVLVQPMLESGVEIVVGSQLDPTFGPLVVVGLGGVMVELLRDATTELAPVNHAQARAMLERLQGFPLLTGFRGSAPVDLDKLCEVIVRVSQAAAELADVVAEIDVNPVICGPDRAIAVDALVVRRSAD